MFFANNVLQRGHDFAFYGLEQWIQHVWPTKDVHTQNFNYISRGLHIDVALEFIARKGCPISCHN